MDLFNVINNCYRKYDKSFSLNKMFCHPLFLLNVNKILKQTDMKNLLTILLRLLSLHLEILI